MNFYCNWVSAWFGTRFTFSFMWPFQKDFNDKFKLSEIARVFSYFILFWNFLFIWHKTLFQTESALIIWCFSTEIESYIFDVCTQRNSRKIAVKMCSQAKFRRRDDDDDDEECEKQVRQHVIKTATLFWN